MKRKLNWRLLSIALCAALGMSVSACRGQSAADSKAAAAKKDAAIFKITIDRKIASADCTEGYILINGKVIGYTLELPDKNNTEYISSIPKDTYVALIRTDGTKGWRIELQDVPHRKVVEIHVGNYTRDTQGCILVGKKVDINNCVVIPSIIKVVEQEFNAFTRDLVLNNPNPKPIRIEVEIAGI